jgi:hypothetical protein
MTNAGILSCFEKILPRATPFEIHDVPFDFPPFDFPFQILWTLKSRRLDLSATRWQEGANQVPEVRAGGRFGQSKVFGLVIGAAIGAEQEIHERGNVGVIAGVAVAIVVPVVEFRGADEHAQRADGKPDIGVNVDRPNASEGNQAGNGFEGETEGEGGEVDDAHGVNGVKRVLAMSGKPVEMLRAVVDRVEPPKKADAVLKAMAPVDEKVAQQNHFKDLEPPGLRSNGAAKSLRNDAVEPIAEPGERPQYEAAPEQVLAKEKAKVGEPGRTKEALASLGGEDQFERPEDQNKEAEAKAGAGDKSVHIHGVDPGYTLTGTV